MLSAFSFVDFYGNGDPFTNRLNALTFLGQFLAAVPTI